MADYHLRRAHSMTIIPQSRSLDSPITSNLAQDRYKPHWQPSTYYRYIRGEDLFDGAPRQRYRSSRVAHMPPSFTVHRFNSNGTPNPIHVPSYWPGYNGYCFNEYPRYGSKYQDCFLEWDYLNPYRSRLLDSMSDSSHRGLNLHRQGFIPYSSVLDCERLIDRSYDRRFMMANNVYKWDKTRTLIPSYFDYESRRYFTNWS